MASKLAVACLLLSACTWIPWYTPEDGAIRRHDRHAEVPLMLCPPDAGYVLQGTLQARRATLFQCLNYDASIWDDEQRGWIMAVAGPNDCDAAWVEPVPTPATPRCARAPEPVVVKCIIFTDGGI